MLSNHQNLLKNQLQRITQLRGGAQKELGHSEGSGTVKLKKGDGRRRETEQRKEGRWKWKKRQRRKRERGRPTVVAVFLCCSCKKEFVTKWSACKSKKHEVKLPVPVTSILTWVLMEVFFCHPLLSNGERQPIQCSFAHVAQFQHRLTWHRHMLLIGYWLVSAPLDPKHCIGHRSPTQVHCMLAK